MKKYMEYMDGVRASDTLHQRLLGLEAAEKRPVAWKKYGALAAALALVVGLGGYGMHYYNTMVNPRGDKFLETTLAFDPEVHPDIAIVEPGDVTEPGEKTLGGYEVTSGSGPNAMVTYYVLPYIDYGDTDSVYKVSQIAADWDIPQGATRRDLTQDEIAALMGGEGVLSTHLDWGGYQLSGWAAWYEDGSFWGAYVYGAAGLAEHFEFAVTADQLPPTCFAYPGSVTQEIRGLTITADGYDSVATPGGGVDASSRRVSFMNGDYGYRFDITGTSRALTEERVSRLVCHVADRGLELSVVGGAIPEFVPDYDPTYEDGLPGYDSNCPYCVDGTVHTHPYDPAGPVSVSDAPAASEEICGYPLAPDTHVCEVCGEAVPNGMAHDCAATHTCEVCGQTLLAGVEHSHQQNHHQEQHHGGHH